MRFIIIIIIIICHSNCPWRKRCDASAISLICRYLSSAISLICRYLSSAISFICRYLSSTISLIYRYLFMARVCTKVGCSRKKTRKKYSHWWGVDTNYQPQKRTRCCSVISSSCCHIFTARFHTIQSIAAPENTAKNLHELMSCWPFFPLWSPSLSRFTWFEWRHRHLNHTPRLQLFQSISSPWRDVHGWPGVENQLLTSCPFLLPGHTLKTWGIWASGAWGVSVKINAAQRLRASNEGARLGGWG